MALTDANITTAAFSGSEIILEHNDEVTVTFWNRSVDSGSASYYLPAVAISLSLAITFDYDNQDTLYGCVPPSNPAAGSANEEYYTVYYEYAWELVSGPGYGYVELNSGSTYGTLANDDLHVLGSTGSTGTRSGTWAAGTSTYYDSPLGSAAPYYLEAVLYSQNTAPRSIYKITSFNVYYRKHIP